MEAIKQELWRPEYMHARELREAGHEAEIEALQASII